MPGRNPAHTAGPAIVAGWDQRLYAGLRVACVPEDVRAALARALGDVGVEAEHFLALATTFVRATEPMTPQTGDAFLLGLHAASQRLRRVAQGLEIATQSYLGALEAGYPSIHLADFGEDVWWPPFAGYALGGEPLELRLRRCGFAYRHVVATHLASNVEAVTEHMALLLHALTTLPPAGVLPASALYTGLSELTSALQGYLIPHHVIDLNEATPGLLTGIARLRKLTASDDTSLDGDIAWARAQFTFTHQLHAGSAGQSVWHSAQSAAREWQSTIAALESMRR
jgi:hypothetical protein